MSERAEAAGSRSVLRRALANPALRRVQIAYAGFNAAEYGEWIAVLVYAYGHGGTTVAAAVAAVQLVPCVVAAPLFAGFADRHPPGRVLVAGYVALGLGMLLTAGVMFAGAPPVIVYTAAIVAGLPFTVTRPTQATLLPGVARTPDELTAANVVGNWAEGAGIVAGPLLASVALSIGQPGLVLAVFGVVGILCAVTVWPVRSVAPAGSGEADDEEASSTSRGISALRENPSAGFLVGLVGVQAVVIGALDLLNVLLAFQILDGGRATVGYLNAAFGAGGIAGGALAVVLVGRRRLAPPLLVGVVVWSGAFVVLGTQSSVVVALALLAVSGGARSLVDVSGRTLLQRVCDPQALARVFGVLEGLDMAGYAAGSLLVPLLVAIGGSRGAIVGVGLVLPVAMLVGGRRLRRIDDHATVPIVEISLLRLTALFAPLPAPALEGVARSLIPVSAPAQTTVIAEGDPGDRYYVVADGTASVSRHGALVAQLGRGSGFGEIALLRDVARTATVTATSDLSLYALGKDDFLAAVTGHVPSHRAAQDLASERLADAATTPRRPGTPAR